jgi:hypothetical protein
MAMKWSKKEAVSSPAAPEESSVDETMRQRIAQKAYELYLERGCLDGYDVEDWLKAEQLVLGGSRKGSKTKLRAVS